LKPERPGYAPRCALRGRALGALIAKETPAVPWTQISYVIASATTNLVGVMVISSVDHVVANTAEEAIGPRITKEFVVVAAADNQVFAAPSVNAVVAKVPR
jgi:hypothetical protein